MRSLSIQPSPYGSLFTSSGSADRAPLMAVTSPETGAKRSLTALTDSTTPNGFASSRARPVSGNSTKTMSPSWSAAYWVIPTVASSPSTRIHSWSRVYRRSLGALTSIAPPIERQRDDPGRNTPVSDLDVDHGARLAVLRCDIGHRDRHAERRRLRPARNGTAPPVVDEDR